MTRHVLSIGYGRQLFEAGNGERERLRACAEYVPEYHQIVFSHRSHNLKAERVSGRFLLTPTNSRFRFLMIYDAVRLGRRIMRSLPPGTAWCVTSQDPLGSGIAGYMLSKLMSCPLIVQEHGDIFSGTHWRNESMGNRLWYYVARWIMLRADRARAVSARVAEHIGALGVLPEKIRSVPVFSDIASFRNAESKEDVRAMVPGASVVVLSVARFVPQKNLILLLRAFEALYATDACARLVLVGRGPLQKVLEQEVSSRGLGEAVRIIPWTDDVASLMKSADIYALSSNYEGWARVLVEAMASGLPAVSTEVGCAGEIFKDHEHGLVVPVGDEKAFADALIALSQNVGERSRLREQALRDVGSAFEEHASYMRRWASVFDFVA